MIGSFQNGGSEPAVFCRSTVRIVKRQEVAAVMLAMVLTEPRVVAQKERPPLDRPEKEEVSFRILQTGICGSDTLAYRGLHKYVTFPLVLGHECVALVTEVGEQVTDVGSGDLITVQPQLTCGKCYACRHGRINVCENKRFMGINTDGFFTEYYKCPANNIVKLPDDFTADMGMLIEPFAVGANAAERAGAKSGKNIVVVGAGTIGNCTAQIAKSMGADVLITDVRDEKLRYAQRCGIGHCANTGATGLKKAIFNAFGAMGADVIIDCCAVPQVFNEIVSCAANASCIVLVGTYEREVAFDAVRVQRAEIDIISVMQYVRRHYLTAIDLMRRGKLHIDGFITARYPLRELNEAFQFIENHPDITLKLAVEIGR